MSNRHAPSPRHRAAAVLLPFLGLFLLMPPVIRLVAVPIDVWGIPLIVVYLNRLSDWLFVQARLANKAAGVEDVPWKP